eukprot:6730253-Pyramimonas_sp.AAC.1
MVDEAFSMGGQHLSLNVISKEELQSALERPEDHPKLFVCESGYTLRWDALSKAQQNELLARINH